MWGARLWAALCRFRGTTLSSYIQKYKRERRLIADRPLMAEHYSELGFGSDPVTGLEAFEGILDLGRAQERGRSAHSGQDRLSSQLPR